MGRYLDIARAVKSPENCESVVLPLEPVQEVAAAPMSGPVAGKNPDRGNELNELNEIRGGAQSAPTPRPDKTDKRCPAGGRAVVLQVPDGVPEAWVQGVADLLVMSVPADWPAARWSVLQGDARTFLETWGGQAARLGCGEGRDLFSVHVEASYARLDGMGLVPLLGGRFVVALTVDQAAIEASRGTLTYRRRQTWPPDCCLIWELEGQSYCPPRTPPPPNASAVSVIGESTTCSWLEQKCLRIWLKV